MSSRFVSAGTASASSASPTQKSPPQQTARDAEWAAARSNIEQNRIARAEAASNPDSNDGKTLYEILQANKAAKQEAFEESIKLKNQFRALNDEEVDFLEETRERERAEEDKIREEERKGLEEFRKAREQEEKHVEPEAGAADREDGGTDWTNAARRKRKRLKGGEAMGLKGAKMRKSSSGDGEDDENAMGKTKVAEKSEEAPTFTGSPSGSPEDVARKSSVAEAPQLVTGKLTEAPSNALILLKTSSTALVGYSSDDDD